MNIEELKNKELMLIDRLITITDEVHNVALEQQMTVLELENVRLDIEKEILEGREH